MRELFWRKIREQGTGKGAGYTNYSDNKAMRE